MSDIKMTVDVEGTADAAVNDERRTVNDDAKNDASLSLPSSSSSGSKKRPITPITPDGNMPQKKFYRQRAHCNPLSHNDAYDYPLSPDKMDWSEHYPIPLNDTDGDDENDKKRYLSPTVLDIGCGFGGLTLALATILPNEVILGMEIRAKVTEYVRLRIVASRKENETGNQPQQQQDDDDDDDVEEVKEGSGNKEMKNDDNTEKSTTSEQDNTETKKAAAVPTPSTPTTTTTKRSDDSSNNNTTTAVITPYYNCSVMRTNSMKFLSNYFTYQSMNKLFFCFPDPHFKRKNFGRRIISERLLTEYAYILKVGGKLYCITDVLELHTWHVEKCNNHPLFRKITNEEVLDDDPCVQAMKTETEESKKVDRNKGQKYYAVYERIDPNDTPNLYIENFFGSNDDNENNNNNNNRS